MAHDFKPWQHDLIILANAPYPIANDGRSICVRWKRFGRTWWELGEAPVLVSVEVSVAIEEISRRYRDDSEYLGNNTLLGASIIMPTRAQLGDGMFDCLL
jgi:hypothetical protein